MALDTSPIDELIRDRVEKLPTDPLAEITDETLHRLADIAVLKHVQNGDEQRARYNRTHDGRRWEDEFAPATKRELDRMRGTMLARAQRAFTSVEQRVKPVLGRRDYANFSLDGIPMSPDKISGAHLVKAGFVNEEELHQLNGDEIGRLVVKHDEIASWQMFLEAMKPIGPEGRLQRIAMPTEEMIKRPAYKDAKVPNEDLIGGVGWFREKTGGRKDGDQQLQIFEGGLGDAIRKTAHVDKGYTTEIDTLATCQRDLEAVRDTLNREYRRGKSTEEKKELWAKAEKIILRSWEALGEPQDHNKVHAVTMLAAASSLEDSSGKENVSIAMVRITSALDKIALRFDDARTKGSFNTKDRITLQNQITRGEGTMLAMRHAVMDATEDVAKKPDKRSAIARKLLQQSYELEKLEAKPFSTTANAMIAQLQDLAPDNPDAFEDQLLTLHVLGKIQWLVSSIERVKMDIALSTGEIDYAKCTKAIERIEATFGAEQVMPGKRIEKLKDIMEDLATQVAGVRTVFEGYTANPPQEKRPKAEDILKREWKSIHTTGAVQTIGSWLPEAVPMKEYLYLTS